MKLQLVRRWLIGSGLFIMSMMVVMHMKDVAISVDASNATTPSAFTSAGFNNPTVVTDVVISQTMGDAIQETSLVPQSNYFINATIQDFDGFAHLDVYFIVYYAENEEVSDSFVRDKIDQGVTAESFVVRYFSPERSTHLMTAPNVLTDMTIITAVDNYMVKNGSTPVDLSGVSDHQDYTSLLLFNALNDHTWSLLSGSATVTGTELVDTVPMAYERDVSIEFTTSKVAPQGLGTWHVAVVTYDRYQMEIPEPNSQELYIYSQMESGYNMAFYGEIQLEPGQQIDFDRVLRGLDTWTDSSTGVMVRYIANGTFSRTATADVRWDATHLDVYSDEPWAELHDPLVMDETKQYFTLQVFRDAGTEYAEVEIQEDATFATSTLPIAILPGLDPDYTIDHFQSMTSVVESNVGRTTELGQLTPFLFQIKLSPAFQNATYTGNMTIGISGG